jgi:SIR2-like domain
MVTICQLFFFHWKFEIQHEGGSVSRPPKELSISFTEAIGNDVLTMGESFAKGNSVLIAQQIKNCIRDIDWVWLLRKCLYGEFNSREIHDSRLIDLLIDLCTEEGCVQAVVNYNYDSTFEDSLEARAVRFTVVFDSQQTVTRGSLPIYHVHGYLKRGGGPKARIVLAEDDYHEELVAPYSWSNLLQSSLLLRSTCVFVDTSLTDPNLRRILRSTFAIGKRFHYALLPQGPGSPESTMLNALFDKDLYDLGVASIRYPEGTADDPHSWVSRTIEWLLNSRNR